MVGTCWVVDKPRGLALTCHHVVGDAKEVVVYFPAYRNGAEQLILKLNRSQNFLQIFATDSGNLVAVSNLTFYDEIPAKLFEAFLDLFPRMIRRFVLTDEALRMLI
jgi:hypothetical protein